MIDSRIVFSAKVNDKRDPRHTHWRQNSGSLMALIICLPGGSHEGNHCDNIISKTVAQNHKYVRYDSQAPNTPQILLQLVRCYDCSLYSSCEKGNINESRT